MSNLIHSLRNIAVISTKDARLLNSQILSRPFFTSAVLAGVPVKKKKRIDPAILRRQTEKKINRVTAEISRIEAIPRQLKPIIELSVSSHVKKELKKRVRKVDGDKIDGMEGVSKSELNVQYNMLKKIWSVYKKEEARLEHQSLEKTFSAQKRALQQLRDCSEDLYQAAMSVDEKLLPFKSKMKTDTPPIVNIQKADGQKVNITKEYVMQEYETEALTKTKL